MSVLRQCRVILLLLDNSGCSCYVCLWKGDHVCLGLMMLSVSF